MDNRIAQRRQAALRFKAACGEQVERLSLMDPLFNLREIAKQMLLLEDHLQHPYKHCPDCICKHLMTIEAFAEEATTLDKVGTYREFGVALADMARTWLEEFHDDRPLPLIAQEVRGIRKELVAGVSDPRPSASRVASRFIAANTVCPHRRIERGG